MLCRRWRLWPCRSRPFRRSRRPGAGAKPLADLVQDAEHRCLSPSRSGMLNHRPFRREPVLPALLKFGAHRQRAVLLCSRLNPHRRRRNRPHVMIRHHRLGNNKARRPAMIRRGKLSLVGARRAFNLHLRAHRRSMRLMPRHQLSCLRPQPYPRRSAVEADSNIACNNRMHIDVMHHRHIDVVHRAVVEKVSRVPIPSLVPHAPVAEPVIHAAIEPNVPAPITAKEYIVIMRITPVSGRPKRFLVRSLNPYPRHPVVARRCIVPIPGSPDIPIARIFRLIVFRQCRRRVRSGCRRRLFVARVVIVGVLRRRLLIIGDVGPYPASRHRLRHPRTKKYRR